MKRLLLGLMGSIAVALIALPAGVLAEGPLHQHVSGTVTDTNFCGSGKTVNVAFDGVENLWLGPNDYEKSTGQQKTTYTNPLNGKSVEVSSSGPVTVTRIDDAGGGYTFVVSYRGVQEKIVVNGKGKPILSKDVGYLTFYDHYDALNHFIGSDVVEHGPHPEADSDFTLFCQIVPSALGL